MFTISTNIIMKGICRPEEAVRALECGFNTIWISNHGGRQLDTSPATIDILPDIRAAVGPDVEIILDCGVQRGTDIVKVKKYFVNKVKDIYDWISLGTRIIDNRSSVDKY